MRSKILAVLFTLLFILTARIAEAGKGNMPPLPNTKITITWGDLVRMMEEFGDKPAPPPSPPPVDIAVRRAAYAITLGAGRITVKETLNAVTLGAGWHELFITGLETPLLSISVDDEEAVPLIRDNGVYVAIKGEGRRLISVSVAADAPGTPGPHTVTVPVPDAAAAEADLTFPSGYEDISINGIVLASSPGRRSAVMKGRGKIEVTYTVTTPKGGPVEKMRPTGPTNVTAEVMSILDFGEERLSLISLIDYGVKNAPTKSLTIELPKGYELVDVLGEGVILWKVSDDKSELIVTIGYDVMGEYRLKLIFERTLTEGRDKANFPKVMPKGTKRTTGYLTVVSSGGFEVNEVGSSGLSPRDPAELPAAILGASALPPILSYRYLDNRFSLSLGVKRGEMMPALPAFIDSANSVILVTDEGKVVVRTSFFVRNKRLQFLKIVLPADAVLWAATVKGIPVKTVVEKTGVVMIPIPISPEISPEPFIVSAVIFVPSEPARLMGRIVLTMPRLDIPTAEMMVTVYLPEKATYLSFGGDMEQIKYFTEVLSPEASKSFVEENLRLRKSVYKRQEDLENTINEKRQMPENGGINLPPTPEGFDLPVRGQAFRFVKLIVLGEDSKVLARYVDTRLLIGIIMLLLIVLVVAGVRYGRSFAGEVKRRLLNK